MEAGVTVPERQPQKRGEKVIQLGDPVRSRGADPLSGRRGRWGGREPGMGVGGGGGRHLMGRMGAPWKRQALLAALLLGLRAPSSGLGNPAPLAPWAWEARLGLLW